MTRQPDWARSVPPDAEPPVSSPPRPDPPAPSDPAPSPLEMRYRRLLRVLPTPYRAIRETEMVDAFLLSRAAAHPDLVDIDTVYGHPDLAEVVSVLRLAGRLRWADGQAPARYQALSTAARRYALAGSLLLGLASVLRIEGTLWTALTHPEAFPPAQVFGELSASSEGPWFMVVRYAPLLWCAAFGLALCRRGRAAQLVALGIAVVSAVQAVRTPGILGPWAPAWVDVAMAASLTLALGTCRDRPSRPIATGHWLGAAAGGFLVGQAVFFWYAIEPSAPMWNVVDQMAIVMLISPIVAVAAARSDRGSAHGTEAGAHRAGVYRAAAPLGLALLYAALAVLRGGDLVLYAFAFSSGAVPAGLISSVIVQLVLLTATAIAAAVVARIRWRALPAVDNAALGATA